MTDPQPPRAAPPPEAPPPAGAPRGAGAPAESGTAGPEEAGDAQPFYAEMTRFFFVPAVIVLLCVGVFVLFGLIASEGRSARDYLEEIRHGTTNRRWQAAYELSRLLSRRRGAPSDPRLAADVADLLGNPKVDEPLVRRYLILALDGIGDPSVRPAVEAALADPDPEVRLYAARALGTLGDEGSDAALAALLEDPDPSLRKMALHSLGRIGAPGAAAAVRPRLEDPVEDVRWNAALTLAVLGDGSGARVLQQMMDPAHLDRVEGITEAQKIEARINAVQAAFRLREPGLRGDVERLSRTDASLKVRDVALKALAAWR